MSAKSHKRRPLEPLEGVLIAIALMGILYVLTGRDIADVPDEVGQGSYAGVRVLVVFILLLLVVVDRVSKKAKARDAAQIPTDNDPVQRKVLGLSLKIAIALAAFVAASVIGHVVVKGQALASLPVSTYVISGMLGVALLWVMIAERAKKGDASN